MGSIKLFFGGQEVVNNAQISASILNQVPIVEYKQEVNQKYAILLWNSPISGNKLVKFIYWYFIDYVSINYIDQSIEILEYIQPSNLGLYTLAIFKSPNPLASEGGDITRNINLYKSSQFGNLIGKINFFVSGVPALGRDIQKKLVLFKDLDIKGIKSYCSVYPMACTDELWKDLARERLTTDPKILSQFDGQESKQALIAAENLVGLFKRSNSLSTNSLTYEKEILKLGEPLQNFIETHGFELVFDQYDEIAASKHIDRREYLDSFFSKAVRKNHAYMVEKLINLVPEIFEFLAEEDQYLRMALANASVDVARILINKLNDPEIMGDIVDDYTETKNLAIINLFLEKGIDDAHMNTIFNDNENVEIIKRLLEFKPKLINRVGRKYESTDAPEIVEYLNTLEIPQEAVDGALESNAAGGHIELMRLNLTKNPSQAGKNSALQIAKDANREIAVIFLRQNGAMDVEE